MELAPNAFDSLIFSPCSKWLWKNFCWNHWQLRKENYFICIITLCFVVVPTNTIYPQLEFANLSCFIHSNGQLPRISIGAMFTIIIQTLCFPKQWKQCKLICNHISPPSLQIKFGILNKMLMLMLVLTSL